MNDRERQEREREERFRKLQERSLRYRKKEEPEEKTEDDIPEEPESMGFPITGAITTVLIVAVMVIVGALTYGYIRDAIPAATVGYNQTVAGISGSELSVFAVAPVILAAVAILGIVMMLRI